MIIGSYMVIGAGEADRYLKEVLDRTLPLVDWMIIIGNDPDKKTDDLCKSYKKVKYIRRDVNDWATNQWKIKQGMYEKYIMPKNPDWIVCLDADEILDKRITRKVLEEMSKRGEVAFDFYCVQLWDRRDQMRIDGSWGNFWNVRYYKYIKEAGSIWKRTPLHCGLAPVYAYKWRTQSEFLFEHYGYLDPKDREKKIARYKKYDPQAVWMHPNYYWSMEHPESGEYREFSYEDFTKRLKYIVKQPKMAKVIKRGAQPPKKILIIKNKWGIIYNMPENLAREAIARGAELIGEIEASNVKAVPIIDDVKDENKCVVCGWVGEELEEHKKKHE